LPKTPTNSSSIPRYLWFTVLAVLLGAIGLALVMNNPGTDGRDLSTPAKRLVGHWLLHSQSEVPFSHLFFGPVITEDDNRGSVAMIDVDGMVFRGKYRMARQFPHGLDMDIVQDLGPNLTRKVTLTIDRPGSSGRYRYLQFDAEVDLRMAYVDDQTVPPDDFLEQLKASKN
jgi:hypothetical protein